MFEKTFKFIYLFIFLKFSLTFRVIYTRLIPTISSRLLICIFLEKEIINGWISLLGWVNFTQPAATGFKGL